MMRKHYTHMTHAEIEFLRYKIERINKYTLSPHCIDKQIARGIPFQRIFNLIDAYDIIEFHTINKEPRILVRDKSSRYNVCMVIAPLRKTIITVYANSATDNHTTIDMSVYCPNINIMREYQKYSNMNKTTKNGIRII